MPDRAVFDETFWLAYKSVNEKFAQETLERLRQLDPVRSFSARLCSLKGLFRDIIKDFCFRLYGYKKWFSTVSRASPIHIFVIMLAQGIYYPSFPCILNQSAPFRVGFL